MSPQKMDQQKIHCAMESKENEEMIRNVTAKLDSIHSEIERQRQTLKVKAKSDEESKHIPGRRKTKFTERKRISERSPTEYAEELRRLTEAMELMVRDKSPQIGRQKQEMYRVHVLDAVEKEKNENFNVDKKQIDEQLHELGTEYEDVTIVMSQNERSEQNDRDRGHE